MDSISNMAGSVNKSECMNRRKGICKKVVIGILSLCQIRSTNTFSSRSLGHRTTTTRILDVPFIAQRKHNDMKVCVYNANSKRTHRGISRLYSRNKVDEDWIAFLKQQKENNSNGDDNTANGGKLGIRDRMRKWLTFKKSRQDSSSNEGLGLAATTTPPSSSDASSSPLVQPIQLDPQQQEERVFEEEDEIDKMRSIRDEQRQQRQERIQEKMESSWSLDAALKDDVVQSQPQPQPQPQSQPLSEQDASPSPTSKLKLKNEYILKQETLRQMVTQQEPKEKTEADATADTSNIDNPKSSLSIRTELNARAYDALQLLRDKRKQYPLKQQSQPLEPVTSTWFEDPLDIEDTTLPDDPHDTNTITDIFSDDKDNNLNYNDRLFQTGDGRVLEIATKQVPINKQMYRSIASKQPPTNIDDPTTSSSNANDNKYQQYDSFLQKEEQMRKQMQDIRTNTTNAQQPLPTIMTPEQLMLKKKQIQDNNTRKKQQEYSKPYSASNVDKSMTSYQQKYEDHFNTNKPTTNDSTQPQNDESTPEWLHLDHQNDLHRDGDDFESQLPQQEQEQDHTKEFQTWMNQQRSSSFPSLDDIDDDTMDQPSNLPSTPFFQDSTPPSNDDIEQEQDFSNTYTRISNNDLEDMFQQSRNVLQTNPLNNDVYVHKGSDINTDANLYTTRKIDLLQRYTNQEITTEEVNALMEYNYTSYRLLSINKPDTSFGAIFKCDGLILDMTDLYYDIWLQVYNQTYASSSPDENEEEQINNDLYYDYTRPLRPPTKDEVYLSQTYTPEEVIKTIFFWTNDYFEARDIANLFLQILNSFFQKDDDNNNNNDNDDKVDNDSQVLPMILQQSVHVNEGIHQWLEELQSVDMPCSIISNLNYEQLDILLNYTNLGQYFPHDSRVVTASFSDHTKVESQQMLNAAIRLNRRPDHCVVFDTTPSSAIAAHVVDMRHVAFMGLYPMYELNTADCIIDSWDEMTVMNVRRLFSDKNYDDEREPMFELEREATLVKPNSRLRRWAEGDRD